MSNNTTCSLLRPSFDASKFSCDTKIYGLQGFHEISLIVSVFVAILSPVTVVGNALVLAAIWRNPSLRTPSYILLAGLAITDFCTGVITEPLFVANTLIFLKNPQIISNDENSWPTFYLITTAIGHGSSEYFYNMTLMMIAFMSIERWLHMSRRLLITVRCLYRIVAVLFFLPIPYCVYRLKDSNNRAFHIASMLLLLLCLAVTSGAYFKVFRIIRQHQQQIYANQLSQNVNQPTINLEKYKKSAFSILYIIVMFYIGYLPMPVALGLSLFTSVNLKIIHMSFVLSLLLQFLSSSLNPLLYLWRMKDIRNEVKTLVKRILCKNN